MTNDSSNSRDKPAGLNAGHSDETAPVGLPRRDFFKVAGAGAGALLISGAGSAGAATPAPKATRSVRSASASPDVVVVGAGLWGSFTAYHLRKSGVSCVIKLEFRRVGRWWTNIINVHLVRLEIVFQKIVPVEYRVLVRMHNARAGLNI